ncbi:MAG: Flagellar biosynthetic protein FlhB [Pseudomonadota bacterium]|jgi:flagellar biosynthesis protein
MKRGKSAIALEYGGQTQAPIVVAKGSGDIAERIIEEARKRGVFIAEDPKLLDLLAQLEMDQEIPVECYTAVAVVLAWAYRLRGELPTR